MKNPASTALIATGSHLLVFALGWGIWSACRSEPVRTRIAEQTKSFRSKDRAAPRIGGEYRSARQILGDIQRDKTAPVAGVKVKRVVAYRSRLMEAEALRSAAEHLERAADPEAAAKAALDAYLTKLRSGGELPEAERAEAEIRMFHWLGENPQAVLAYLSGQTADQMTAADPLLIKALDALIPAVGTEEAAKWMGTTGRMDSKLGRIIADHAGAAADLEQLSRIKGSLDQQRWNEIRLSLIDTWPFAKADDLMRLSITENAPLTVLLYAKHQGPDGVRWLHRHLDSAGTDPAFKASVLKHHDYHQLMFASPQLEFEKRVEVVQAFQPGKPLDQVKYELGVFDVVDALNSGRDWRFAFRHGAATAEQIYQEMAAALPELASKSQDSLRLQLFKELSEFGGPKAVKLLDGMPDNKKWELVMKSPEWQFLHGNPQDFYEMIRTVPADAGQEVWDTRLTAWERKSRTNHERLGPQYIEWVKNLPEGIDREMASYAVLKQNRGADPALKELLRSRIKDPQLKQRLEGVP